jgi:potassium-dependent mechanosensitive channel
MNQSSFWQNLRDLFESIVPILERPAVQLQIAAFGIILILAWGIPTLGTMLFARLRGNQTGATKVSETFYRWSRTLGRLTLPLLGLFLAVSAIAFFNANHWYVGLLVHLRSFFLLLLAFRTLVALLYLVLTESRAVLYHNRFLKPLFLVVVLVGLNQLLRGIVSLADLRLLSLAGLNLNLTVSSLFTAGVIFYLFLVASWIVQDILAQWILPRMQSDEGAANTVASITHYVIISTGILTALGSLGLDLSSLAIIGAGLSVGIGFGLQELIANFVSGIILLFEQSIRPGDIIDINNQMGQVSKLSIRATTIRTRDNVEIIVPNQSLLTSSVTTYTHRDSLVRVLIRVGVSYESDVTEVRDALMAAAARHGLVRKRPEPTVFFQDFGSSSLDFELGIWLSKPEMARQVRSDLRFIIWDELKKRKINIPFPQQDLHIRSGVPWEMWAGQPVTKANDPPSVHADGSGKATSGEGSCT